MNAVEAMRHQALRVRALRAYEAGRASWSLARAAWLLPAAGAAYLCCPEPGRIVASAAALVLAVAFCLWRGQAWGRGVRPGLLAGAAPMLVPIVAQAISHACTPAGCSLYPTVCILAGVAGGIALPLLAPRPGEGRGIPLVAASLIAGLAGSVGCLIYGLIGVAGMAAGLIAGAMPVLAARHARG
ncbi:MAG: hypothetical protein ACREAA_10355 [Candidatus Polarisedimenticolia bacterium]